MWFEDRSLSNMKVSSLIVEEWRDIWSTKTEFMFAAFAYIFAATNLLNLPRLILDNGGSAFLIAYAVCLLVVVLPILILELTVGQLTGRSPVQAFYNICPVFKGVGIAQILFSIIVMATMSRFLAWILFYIYHLFWTLTDDRPGLPWLHCKNFPEFQFGDCLEPTTVLSLNNTLYIYQRELATGHEDSAMSHFTNALDASSGNIATVGHFQLHWLIAESVVWLMVFCAICFGVRWLGKVLVFTFVVPLILLLALCARALFLPGAIAMFQQLFVDTFDWHILFRDYMVWKSAAEQAIIATGLGFGAFITMGSYNKRSNNLVQDAFCLVIVHLLISVLQIGIVIALVGHVSDRILMSANELIGHGEYQFHQLLAYLAYVPHTKILSGMLLFMLAFALVNIFYLLALNVLASLEDALGEKWSKCFPRFSLALLICLLGMTSSLFFATQAGKYGYELVSGYMKYLTLSVILASELVAVAWIYCVHSLGMDLKGMLQGGCAWCIGHFLLFFNYILPLVPIAIAVFNVMGYSYQKYSPEIRSWEWSELVGISIALFPLIPIPLWAAITVFRSCIRGARISPCKRFCLAFRSPLRYELIRESTTQLTISGGHHQHHPLSRHYSASGGTGGYVLLPQAPAAPLAQPESDDVIPGSARAVTRHVFPHSHPNNSNLNTSISSTLRATTTDSTTLESTRTATAENTNTNNEQIIGKIVPSNFIAVANGLQTVEGAYV